MRRAKVLLDLTCGIDGAASGEDFREARRCKNRCNVLWTGVVLLQLVLRMASGDSMGTCSACGRSWCLRTGFAMRSGAEE